MAAMRRSASRRRTYGAEPSGQAWSRGAEALNQIEPGAVLGREGQGKAALRLLGKPSLCLSRAAVPPATLTMCAQTSLRGGSNYPSEDG